MALPLHANQVKLSDIQTEFGGANPIKLSEYYAGGGIVASGATGEHGAIPSSGEISIDDFHGATAVVAPTQTNTVKQSPGSTSVNYATTESISTRGLCIDGSYSGLTATEWASGFFYIYQDGSNTYITYKAYRSNDVDSSWMSPEQHHYTANASADGALDVALAGAELNTGTETGFPNGSTGQECWRIDQTGWSVHLVSDALLHHDVTGSGTYTSNHSDVGGTQITGTAQTIPTGTATTYIGMRMKTHSTSNAPIGGSDFDDIDAWRKITFRFTKSGHTDIDVVYNVHVSSYTESEDTTS